MDEDWEFFPRMIGGHRAIVFVDLAREHSTPERQRPWIVRIEVALQDAGPDGLGNDDENNRLYEIEDRLFETLSETVPACRYVGRITTGGQRTFFYYAANEEGITEQVREAFAAFPAYQPQATVQLDPAWEVFARELRPGPFEHHLITNQRLIRALLEAGDRLENERPVDHWLYFPSSESRQRFLDQIANEGFDFEELDPSPEGDPQLPHGLHLQRTDRVTPEWIDPLTANLFYRAEDCGGKYDGWGAAVSQ